MNNIASIDLELARLDNGVRKKVTLSVGQPWKVSDQEWSTRITDPESNQKQIVSGNDAIQVLAIALVFLGKRMEAMKALGHAWYYPGTDYEFPIDAYFFPERFQNSIKRKQNQPIEEQPIQPPRD